MSATYACACGAQHTEAQFGKLQIVGVFGSSGAPDSQGPWRAVEVRRCCACDRTLARRVVLANARRTVDTEATDERPLDLRRAFAGDPDEEA